MNYPVERAALHEYVAGEIRAYLARARLSGRRAALQLGWTQPYMSRRLTGDIPFDVTDLEALAGLLDVPVTAFFGAGPNDWGGTQAQVSAGSRTGSTLRLALAA
jgi:transcriptional regulator with XRE-family HTH domain